jgi:uncharacterized repeat protein (TIGR02543 family)
VKIFKGSIFLLLVIILLFSCDFLNPLFGNKDGHLAIKCILKKTSLSKTTNDLTIEFDRLRCIIKKGESIKKDFELKKEGNKYKGSVKIKKGTYDVIIYGYVSNNLAYVGTTSDVNVSPLKTSSCTVILEPNQVSLATSVQPNSSGSITKTPDKTTYNYNETVQLNAIPSNGYKFDSWSGDISGTNDSTSIKMTSDKTILANFSIQSFTLTVGTTPSGSGSVNINPDKSVYTMGEKVTLSAQATTGYKFIKWEGDTTGTIPVITITMNSNKNITAVFDLIEGLKLSIISIPTNGGSVNLNPNKTTYSYGESVILTALPADGYDFGYWSGDASGSNASATITMNANKTVTANFTRKDYSLAINITPTGGGTVTKSPSKSTYFYEDQVTLTATPASGYRFVRWEGDASGTNASTTITIDTDENVTAVFEQIIGLSLTISSNPATGGSVTKNPDKTSYTYGETVTLTAIPANGYDFDYWSGDASGSNTSTAITMNANKTVTANFTPKEYSVTINITPSGGGTVTKSPNQSTYSYGDQVTLTATPASGYSFVRWEGGASGTSASTILTIDSDENVTAVFETISGLSLTVSSSPSTGGSITKNPDKTSYTYGETVTLTALPANGYDFGYWSDDASGTNASTTITMDANKSVTANFNPIEYSLAISITPIGGGTVTKDPNKSTYSYGDPVTLTASPATGYTFIRWEGDASGTNASTTITITGNKTISAVFEIIDGLSLTVSSNPSDGGSVTKSPDKTSYTYGETVTLTAMPANGYDFDYWSDDASGSTTSTTINMDANKSVTADFTPIEYTLAINITPTGGGTVTKSPNKSTYSYGDQVTLTATPATGYIFIRWEGDASGTNASTTITIDSDESVTAVFEIHSGLSLTVSSNPPAGGSVAKSPGKTSYTYGETVTLTAVPADGFIFDYWSGDASGSNTSTTITMNANKTVTANFTPIEYSLAINITPTGGGTVTKSPNKSTYNYGDQVTLIATPASGYSFARWEGDASGTNASTTITIDSNESVTAVFEQSLGLSLTLSSNPPAGGTVTKSPDKTSYTYGEIVTLTANPDDGFYFGYWSGDASGTDSTITITMNDNKTVTANFSLIPYTLSVNINPSGGGTVSKSPNQSTYSYGDEVTLTVTPATGYGFVRWEGDASGIIATTTITIDRNKTVTAVFEPITGLSLTVSSIPSAGGSITKNPDKTSYTYGETVTLTAIPDTGYYFNYWSGNAGGTNPSTTTTMDANKTVTANFALIPYTLTVTVTPSNGGSVSRIPYKSTYSYDDEVTLTATPGAGYSFVRWEGDASGTNASTTVTINGNKSITAVFEITSGLSLTISSNPSAGGSVTKSPDKTSYTYGESVTLTAVPADGYSFDYWSDDTSGSNTSTTITMDENKTVTANFSVIPYSLTVSVNPTGGGTVTKSPNQSTYNYGDQVTLTATPAIGYTFTNWTGDASGTNSSTIITLDDNKTVSANFSLIEYSLTVNITPTEGGTVTKSPNQSTYNYGDQVTLTATPVTGYTFTNWAGDASGTNSPTIITMDDNKTVTANFLPEEYSVTINISPIGGGTVTKSPNQSTYNYGDQVTLTATPASGYTFANWQGDASGTNSSTTITINGDKNITAVFEAISAMVAYYPFEGNANDESVNGLNGTEYGGLQYATGISSQAASFDGTDDYSEVAANDLLNFGTGDFSISLWVKTSSNETQTLFMKGGHQGRYSPSYYIRLNEPSGKIAFVTGSADGSSVVLGSDNYSVSDGDWHHLIAMRSGSNLYVYMDNQLIMTTSGDMKNVSSSESLTIGAHYVTNSPNLTFFLNGLMDELRFYNYALTTNEIQSLYDEGSLSIGLQAFYSFEGNANDAGGNNFHGTENGGLQYVSGKQGFGAQFDGVDDWIDIGDNHPFINESENLTITCWYKASGDFTRSDYNGLFSLMKDPGVNPNQTQITFGAFWENQKHYSCFNLSDYRNSGTTGNYGHGYTNSETSINEWIFKVATLESGTLKLYINGNLVDSDTSSNPLIIKGGSLQFGYQSSTYNNRFEGIADEIRIYNRALSDSEIQSLYNSYAE